MKRPAAIQLTTADARRLLLAGSGLLQSPERPKKPLAVIRDLSFIQLDSINVIERAHELILHTRSDDYRREEVFRHLRAGKLFEHWTHDASLLPAEHYSHWHHRFERFRTRGWHLSRMGEGAEELAPKILERIAAEGPLMSRDFEDHGAGDAPRGGWWNWKPAKAVLEYLWRTGQLTISDRRNFQKVYELPERHFRNFKFQISNRAATLDWACTTALACLGVATPAELAAFHRIVELPETRGWVHDGLASGRLAPVEVRDEAGAARTSIAFADIRKRVGRLSDAPTRVRFLAPFDPLIRDRGRAERLFGFRYRFEAFTPEAKRIHGYYVLPILQADRIVGRADAKFDRQSDTLRLKFMPFEPGFKPDRSFRTDLDVAAGRLQQFVGAARLDLRKK